MDTVILQIEGLPGPSHHFGGLSVGNLASIDHAQQVSSPKQAALQCLDKMKWVAEQGVPVAICPPHPRPHIPSLDGLDGDLSTLSPLQLSHAFSSAHMWVANMGTAYLDENGVTHLSVANLAKTAHRRIEAAIAQDILNRYFASDSVVVHGPCDLALGDEGAANHFCLYANEAIHKGVNCFVYGKKDENEFEDRDFPKRQDLGASQAVANTLGIKDALFLQQSQRAIHAGVFHNDVILASEGRTVLTHNAAFEDSEDLERLHYAFEQRFERPLELIVASEKELPLEDLVKSYIFNGQIIRNRDGKLIWILDDGFEQIPSAQAFVDRVLCESEEITQIHSIPLSQSMNNGGGPACLRLRVPMTRDSLEKIDPSILWSPDLDRRLRDWVTQYYPEQLSLCELATTHTQSLIHQAFENIKKH